MKKYLKVENIGWFIAITLLTILFLCQLGIIHSIYTDKVKAAPKAWHAVGFVGDLFSVAWCYGMFTDKYYVTKNEMANAVILVASIAFAAMAWAGFVFNG
jgi:hypothetical protein